ncbi:MAG: DDE-type integrase/transposase/recombinase [Polaromonas sp.]|nr:DDE-type integrase/transposase/recombinase [Polaromonas sp.]NMM11704.1 DDE-type integrase/transposase/recombinase [Polaromonas sp.]
MGGWRIDKTYIKVNGAWKYPYRAVTRKARRST